MKTYLVLLSALFISSVCFSQSENIALEYEKDYPGCDGSHNFVTGNVEYRKGDQITCASLYNITKISLKEFALKSQKNTNDNEKKIRKAGFHQDTWMMKTKTKLYCVLLKDEGKKKGTGVYVWEMDEDNGLLKNEPKLIGQSEVELHSRRYWPDIYFWAGPFNLCWHRVILSPDSSKILFTCVYPNKCIAWLFDENAKEIAKTEVQIPTDVLKNEWIVKDVQVSNNGTAYFKVLTMGRNELLDFENYALTGVYKKVQYDWSLPRSIFKIDVMKGQCSKIDLHIPAEQVKNLSMATLENSDFIFYGLYGKPTTGKEQTKVNPDGIFFSRYNADGTEGHDTYKYSIKDAATMTELEGTTLEENYIFPDPAGNLVVLAEINYTYFKSTGVSNNDPMKSTANKEQVNEARNLLGFSVSPKGNFNWSLNIPKWGTHFLAFQNHGSINIIYVDDIANIDPNVKEVKPLTQKDYWGKAHMIHGSLSYDGKLTRKLPAGPYRMAPADGYTKLNDTQILLGRWVITFN